MNNNNERGFISGLLEEPDDPRDFDPQHIETLRGFLQRAKRDGVPLSNNAEMGMDIKALNQLFFPYCVSFGAVRLMKRWQDIYGLDFGFDLNNAGSVIAFSKNLTEESRALATSEGVDLGNSKGTTMRHMCKILKKRGIIKSYHLIPVDLMNLILMIKATSYFTSGSLLFAFRNMIMYKDTGIIVPGPKKSGHCMAGGIYTRDLLGGWNSYGDKWGREGCWYMNPEFLFEPNLVIAIRVLLPNI